MSKRQKRITILKLIRDRYPDYEFETAGDHIYVSARNSDRSYKFSFIQLLKEFDPDHPERTLQIIDMVIKKGLQKPTLDYCACGNSASLGMRLVSHPTLSNLKRTVDLYSKESEEYAVIYFQQCEAEHVTPLTNELVELLDLNELSLQQRVTNDLNEQLFELEVYHRIFDNEEYLFLVGHFAASIALHPALVRGALKEIQLPWLDIPLQLYAPFENVLIITKAPNLEPYFQTTLAKYYATVIDNLTDEEPGRPLTYNLSYQPVTDSAGIFDIFEYSAPDKQTDDPVHGMLEGSSCLAVIKLLFNLGVITLAYYLLSIKWSFTLGSPKWNAVLLLGIPLLGFLLHFRINTSYRQTPEEWAPENYIAAFNQKLSLWKEHAYLWPKLFISFIPLVYLALHWFLHVIGYLKGGITIYEGVGIVSLITGYFLFYLLSRVLQPLFASKRSCAITETTYYEPAYTIFLTRGIFSRINTKQMRIELFGSEKCPVPLRVLYNFDSPDTFNAYAATIRSTTLQQASVFPVSSFLSFYVFIVGSMIVQMALINFLSLHVIPSRLALFGVVFTYVFNRMYHRFFVFK